VRLARFLAAGFATALLDNGVFYVLHRLTGLVFLPLVCSTAVSVAFNYLVVRAFIFDAAGSVPHQSALPKYLGVHGAGLAVRYGIIRALTAISPIPVVAAKLIADGVVYSAKYVIQRDFVFRPTRSAAPESDRSGWHVVPESVPPATQPQPESLP
jgi:putative flippase GtrA